jgi:inner membrane protein involved in colicin E2 resistance
MPVRTSPIKAAIAIAFLLLGSYAIYFGASIKNDYQLAIYGALLVFAGLVLAVLALLDRKRSRFV